MWKEFADFQQFLADQTDLPLVSDYYHDKRAPSRETVDHAGSWAEAISAAAKSVRYRWWADGGFLLFRNRQYLLDDLEEVPARLEESLSAARRERGYLVTAELARAALLSRRQLRRLEIEIPGISAVEGYRGVLSWFAALEPRAARMAQSEKGLQLTSSGSKALRLLYPGGRLDPLLSMFPDHHRLSLSLRQTEARETAVLVITARDSLGSRIDYHIVQRVYRPK